MLGRGYSIVCEQWVMRIEITIVFPLVSHVFLNNFYGTAEMSAKNLCNLSAVALPYTSRCNYAHKLFSFLLISVIIPREQ